MPGPAALIALAARLGIPKAAKLVAEKGVKFLQKRIRQAQKQKTKKQEATGKKFTKKGSQRKQEKATQRKKPKVDSGLSIEESKKLKKVLDRKEKEWRDLAKKEDENFKRISLTIDNFLSCRNIFLLIHGEGKESILRKILDLEEKNHIPILYFLSKFKGDVNVYTDVKINS